MIFGLPCYEDLQDSIRRIRNVTRKNEIYSPRCPRPGDFVQYRSAQGELMGYGLVKRITAEDWYIILDSETKKEVYWSGYLMTRITK